MNVYIIRPGNYTGVELAPELQRAIATSTNWKSVSVTYNDDGYFQIAVTRRDGDIDIDLIIPNYTEIDQYFTSLYCVNGSNRQPGFVPWAPGPSVCPSTPSLTCR
jgi:hypothetical protein